MEDEHIHEWESGSWGVLIGVSRCKRCGKVAQTSDFPVLWPGAPSGGPAGE